MELSGAQVYTGYNPTKKQYEIKFIKGNKTIDIEVDNVNRLELFIGQLEVLKGMMKNG